MNSFSVEIVFTEFEVLYLSLILENFSSFFRNYFSSILSVLLLSCRTYFLSLYFPDTF